jgi:hypothetical protein
MTTTTTSLSAMIAVTEPVFTNPERVALAGFLAGYTGLTREAYSLDLRQFAARCQQHHLRLFQVRPRDIECFARDLEAGPRASDCHPPPVHDRRVLQVRRRGRTAGPFPGELRGRSSLRPADLGWTGTVPGGSSAASPGAPGSANRSDLTPSGTRSSPRRSTQGCRCGMYRKPPPMPIPRTTMRYDRARASLDRHATCIVAAYLAGAVR